MVVVQLVRNREGEIKRTIHEGEIWDDIHDEITILNLLSKKIKLIMRRMKLNGEYLNHEQRAHCAFIARYILNKHLPIDEIVDNRFIESTIRTINSSRLSAPAKFLIKSEIKLYFNNN